MYAAGKIPGSFFRREGRPSEDAILTCRLIDRPLRPSFVKGLRNEIQIVITVLALNPDHLYDVLAINAACSVDAALGPAVLRPDRRCPRRADQGPVGRVPEVRRARDARLRHGRRRPGASSGGDVAIMMVEAEATEHAIALIAGGAQPDRRGRRAGSRGGQAVPRGPVRGAAASWPRRPPRRPREFPVFLDYSRRRYDGGRPPR